MVSLKKYNGEVLRTKYNVKLLKRFKERNISTPETNDMVSEETEQQSDVYITEEEKNDRYFYPVDKIWQRKKLSTLGGHAVIKLEHKSSRRVPLTQNILRLRMKGDGNCFFRSISYAITGSQIYHKVARDRVVDYMKTNENAIIQFGERYLAESGIPDEGIWATEAEIMASAAMLQTDIYVLCSVAGSLVWQNYAAHLLGSGATEDRCIYIVNDSGNHFDDVYSLQK